jgi:cbb3-type cytochrome oxidase subunit 3
MTWFFIALVVALGGIWVAYTRAKSMKAADAAARAQIPVPVDLDNTRININNEADLQRWTKELGVDEWDLKGAVQDVGPDVDAVRKHLRDR